MFSEAEVEKYEELINEAMGEVAVLTLAKELLDRDRIEDLKRACNDEKYREQLYEEFPLRCIQPQGFSEYHYALYIKQHGLTPSEITTDLMQRFTR